MQCNGCQSLGRGSHVSVGAKKAIPWMSNYERAHTHTQVYNESSLTFHKIETSYNLVYAHTWYMHGLKKWPNHLDQDIYINRIVYIKVETKAKHLITYLNQTLF